MPSQILVFARATIYPTEDSRKVETAIKNILVNPQIRIQPASREKSVLVAEVTGQDALVRLKELIRQDRIRDAARSELLGGVSGKSIEFFLNKQVAYANHVSFSRETGESPLGPIEVQIACSDPLMLIDWLAPSSRT